MSTATAYNLYKRSDGGQKKPAHKTPGGKKVGSKAQAPKSFLRDFYLANEKRPPETKASETSHDKRFIFYDPLLHEMLSVKVT